MDKPTVGGWTQSWCTTCKSIGEHVVVAMVGDTPAKVECTTCHKQHQYRAAPPGDSEKKPAKPPRSTTTRRRTADIPAAPVVDLAAKVAARAAQKYDPLQRFALDDVVQHTSFGVGVVTALPGVGRLEVLFPAGTKLLTHDRGTQKVALVRPPPRDDQAGPRVSDAPPPSTKGR